MPKDEPGFRKVMDGIWVVRTFAHYQEKGIISKIQNKMPSNIFILDSGVDLIVFDAGWAGEDNFKNFTDALKAMGRDPKDIKSLIISHWHLDHCGLVNQIKALSGCQVIAQAQDVPYMTHEKVITQEEVEAKLQNSNFLIRALAKILGLTSEQGNQNLPVQADAFLVDLRMEEEMPMGKWKVLHTPGHSAGSLALFEPERKILLVGNWAMRITAQDQKQKAPPTGGDAISNFAPDGDAQALADSVAKLKALNPQIILFSHAGKLP